MFYLVKVLIGRMVAALDRTFSYYTTDPTVKEGERVIVSFGKSQKTIGFVAEPPLKVDEDLKAYEAKSKMRLQPIQSKVDEEPLLSKPLFTLAERMSEYYKCEKIRVLSAFLPPSLKPRDSALKKSQGRKIAYVVANSYDETKLAKNEFALYQKVKAVPKGIMKSKVTAKKALEKLLAKKALQIEERDPSEVPLLTAERLLPIELTKEQEEAYEKILSGKSQVFLLEGVTGSGKTHVYLKLCETYLKKGKGVLILMPEIALNDQMAMTFQNYFTDSISVLNSSLSEGKKYREYQKIISGQSKIVLGTRSAIFAPIENLALIIIDEEHSNSYKQDNVPYYDAITVSRMRSKIESLNVVLGSATPRVIDKARAERGVFTPIYLTHRYSANQTYDLSMVNMENSDNLNLKISSLYSKQMIVAIHQCLEKKEQAMILLNRRGYSPIFTCRHCEKSYCCPNCSIPLTYHKRDRTLRCHHCGYQISAIGLTCEKCGEHDFMEVGYGTERAYEELRFLFPKATIYRLDSDVSSNDVRHTILEEFAAGEGDILLGTQVIAKGMNFPNVTLAGMVDADFTLRLPTYLANEETFDLISQFVGRAGRAKKRGRVIIQSLVPDNPVIQLAAHQDYETFYQEELEERRKYQYPPYTYLTLIQVKGLDRKRVEDVALSLRKYLNDTVGKARVNIYGPSLPYIPYTNGRHCRQILLKYKSIEEISKILDGIRTLKLANKDVEILINVDPGHEGL